jgi:hypothetical protein
MTFGTLVVIAALVAIRRLPSLDADDRLRMMKGAVWMAGGFALTVWLPVRSSLYVVFPTVGFAIAAATIVRAAASTSAPERLRRLATVGVVLPFLLLPIYWSRNVRWTELRTLTNDTFAAIGGEQVAAGTLIVLEDDLSTRVNFRNAFGTMFPEAARLFLPNDVHLWINPPPPEVADPPPDAERRRLFRLRDGRIQSDGEPRARVSP